MKIIAIKGSNDAVQRDYVYQSLFRGTARFGWSYLDSFNLETILQANLTKTLLTQEQKNAFKQANFLLGMAPGDWLVYVGIKDKSTCIAIQVNSTYSWDSNSNITNDFKHVLHCNEKTLIEFDRNNINIPPYLKARLKLPRSHYTINAQKEFFEALDNLKSSSITAVKGETQGETYLKKYVKETLLEQITNQIHKNNPNKNLEHFLADVFNEIPNTTANVNSLGWGTDYGADIIVKVTGGLEIPGINSEITYVVQVKSFQGDHHDTKCVEQIKNAMEKYGTNFGVIITTAKSTDTLTNAIEKATDGTAKQIGLIAGNEVAAFVLRHKTSLFLDV